MGSVVVLTADKTLEILDTALVGAFINVDGQFILQKRSGGQINVGSFASKAQGDKADAARQKTNASITITAGDENGVVETVTIEDDGTDTNSWVNRLVFRFKDLATGLIRNTFFLNEYGELRVAPAKHNTVGARFFVKEFANNPTQARSTTVPVVELMDDRTSRKSLRGWLGDGTETRNGIRMADTLVLGPTDSVPAGTPAGTVIVRQVA